MTISPLNAFQIRDWVEFDSQGRAPCPCCCKGRRDKTLSLVPNSEYGYKCFRGCTPAEIREALGAPPPLQGRFLDAPNHSQKAVSPPIAPKDYTVEQAFVDRAVERLLHGTSEDASAARNWLKGRGILEKDIRRLSLGLGQRTIVPNEDQPDEKEIYGAICIFIAIPDRSERYYVKKRVTPWLKDDQRPEYLGRWSQYGVPATVWFTYLPDEAYETWFCEGEWDAIRLAQLARQQSAKIAVACSTAGCGCVPKAEELARLPGTVTIFYDLNDQPKTDGTRAGDEGAKKLALALNGRGRIAMVPIPENCDVKGWDVSNALDAGYGWSDFQQSAEAAISVAPANGGGSGNGGDGGDGDEPGSKIFTHPAFVPLNASQLLAEIDGLIAKDLPQSQVSASIPALAQRSGYSERAVWKIYHRREAEIEIEEERAVTAATIDALLKAKEASIDLRDVLPNALAEPLLKFATWLSVRPESILLTLLTTVSALHHAQTISWLNRDWDFSVKPNLYSAIVAPPSQKKSPIVKAISRKPLKALEKKARLAWKEQQQQYLEQERFYQSLDKEERRVQFPEGLPPSPRDRRKVYSFTKNTSEGLRNQVEAYPHQGLLAVPDELAGLLKSANAYRGGRGSDEEDLLSYYDGTGETVLRAEGLAGDFDNILLSILGTIQPKVLQKFLSDGEDKNGRWARFMFVNQPLVPSVMSADGGNFDLTPLLADLYEKVNQLPPIEYMPEREAFNYYCAVYNELERRRVVDPSPAMSAVWGKAEGRIGKIATNLHVIHELMAGRIPGQFIPKARYVEATQITLFSIQQVFGLYNELGEADALATHLTKVIDLSRKKGWISARDVQLGYDRKSRPNPHEVRSWFRELEAMSKGVTSGEGRYLKFNAQVVGNVGGSPTNSPTASSIDLSTFQPNVEFVGEGGVFINKNQKQGYDSDVAIASRQPVSTIGFADEPNSFNPNFSQISPTTPTNSTNGHKVEPIGISIVGESSTIAPTISTNWVESENWIEEDDKDSDNDSTLGSSSSKPFNKPDDGRSLAEVASEEKCHLSEKKADVARGNAFSGLIEVQQLLLMCQTITDLLDVKEMYPTESVTEAYNSLNIYERKQIRHIILQQKEPINFGSEVISPCQLLSFFIGQQQDAIQVGDKVDWRECSGHLESWSPFEVLELCNDGWVRLDILSDLVPLCELKVRRE